MPPPDRHSALSGAWCGLRMCQPEYAGLFEGQHFLRVVAPCLHLCHRIPPRVACYCTLIRYRIKIQRFQRLLRRCAQTGTGGERT